MISFRDVEAAAERLRGVAVHTPVIESAALNALAGTRIFLKCENLQRAGAFKFRGAYNRLSQLTEAQKQAGVVTFSSGNHAKALAYAGQLLGISVVAVVPDNAPKIKVKAAERSGARIILYSQVTDDREAMARKLATNEGRILVPPYDDDGIMAGQGTAALELLRDVPDLEAVVAPVGGGGLIAGTATAAKGTSAAITVYGVEPEVGDDTKQSLAAGEIIHIEAPVSIAAGILNLSPGEKTFPVIKARVDAVVTVTEAEIVAALRFCYNELKLVIEPASSVVVAAAMNGSFKEHDRVGVIISAGNVEIETLAGFISPSE